MCFCFCLCLVCFESRRQPLRLVEVWDSFLLSQLRVFTGSLKEDLCFTEEVHVTCLTLAQGEKGP